MCRSIPCNARADETPYPFALGLAVVFFAVWWLRRRWLAAAVDFRKFAMAEPAVVRLGDVRKIYPTGEAGEQITCARRIEGIDVSGLERDQLADIRNRKLRFVF